MSFDDMRRQAEKEWKALQGSQRTLIFMGMATCGRSAGSSEILETFQQELTDRGLDAHIIEVGCIGLCYAEPIVCITKPSRPGICYGNITPERVKELVEGYLVKDNPLPDYALGTIGNGSIKEIPDLFNTSVLKSQVRRTLRNCGFIDPTNINHYLANNGYDGLTKALNTSPEKISQILQKAANKAIPPKPSKN